MRRNNCRMGKKQEKDLSGRKSADLRTVAERVFVAALIVLGLIVSCVVVIRIDPRPAILRRGRQAAGPAQNHVRASRP